MEIVLALAAIVGISLITVPRFRRRSRGRVRADAGKQWTTTAAARRRAHPTAAGARPRAGWGTRRTAAAAAGTGAATAVATDSYDEWDDDLDWGDTAVATPPAPEPPPALPESDLDWQLPGRNGASAEPEAEPEWEDSTAVEEPASTNGNGAVAEPAELEPPAPPAPPAESDWDWEPVVTRTPPAANGARPATARTGARRKVNPLVLVALYALFGIGLIVLAVNVVSGAMSGPETDRTPRASATVQATPEPTPPAASTATSGEAQRLQQAFADQQRALRAQETGAARHARTAARNARAARRRAAARRAARRSASAPTPVPRATATPVPPAPANPTPPSSGGGGGSSGGGGGGGGGCEFCIG
jgi:hypothetical protein